MRYLFVLLSLTAFGADGPALAVDVSASRHPISPDIYGINDYGNTGLSAELRVGATRWGGDAATRYNWKNDSYNAAADWYFTSFPYDNKRPDLLPNASAFDQFVDNNLRNGARSIGTIPMLDWLPSSRTQMCSFSVAKYGPQQKINPYNSDCGNGVKPDGKTQIINDPADVGAPVDEVFAADWVRHIVGRYGPASDGGVQMWSLDNEPEWWMGVHIDIHPKPATYDEMLARGIRYAEAIKAVDPTALVTGPVPSGWMAYFYSAADFIAGWNSHSPWRYDTNPIDRKAHGDVPFLDWYLQQMAQSEQQNGVRLLDYLDVHGYITPAGIAFGNAGGASDAVRLTSTRALWDPNYSFKDDTITEPPRLIPRMREWVARNYPGTKTALTEYNWGALDDITGAIAQADVLGIFGREGLDLGTMWGPPTAAQPAAFAFRMFLNYDGVGGQFGSTSVQTSTGDPDQLSIFAAERSDRALTIMVLNKTAADLSTSVSLGSFAASGTAETYTYSAANLKAIVRAADVAVDAAAGLNFTFPARSITLFVIPLADDGTVPQPVITGISNAASGVGGQISPGEIVNIDGANLGAPPDQVRVLFNGVPAPLLSVNPDGTRLVAAVPYRAALKKAAWVLIESTGVRSAGVSIPVVPAVPGVFSINGADGSLITADNPAAAGDVVTLIATGEGVTDPPGVDGRIASKVLPKPVQACRVQIGGVDAEVVNCGASQGEVGGRLRVDVRVPAGLDAGNAAVVLLIGSASSQDGVTVVLH
jgi:uncharacterized protein (TIGR03437 family)